MLAPAINPTGVMVGMGVSVGKRKINVTVGDGVMVGIRVGVAVDVNVGDGFALAVCVCAASAVCTIMVCKALISAGGLFTTGADALGKAQASVAKSKTIKKIFLFMFILKSREYLKSKTYTLSSLRGGCSSRQSHLPDCV